MKRILSLLLSLTVIISMLGGITSTASAASATEPATVEIGGKTYYKITNEAELLYINTDAETLAASYIVTADIDISATTYTTAVITGEFTGEFIGYNDSATQEELRTITLNISSAENNVGLFSTIGGGVIIKNIKTAGTVTGTRYVGGLFGVNGATALTADATVENCENSAAVTGQDAGGIGGKLDGKNTIIKVSGLKNTGNITASGANVGGVFGYMNDVQASYLVNTGDITSSFAFTGGLIGYFYNGLLEKSYNSGNVTSGTQYVAGIAGIFGSKSSKFPVNISNCYNSGTVKCNNTKYETVGGIISKTNDAARPAVIENSYNSGDIYWGGTTLKPEKGIVGATNSETIRNCYYIASSSGTDVGLGIPSVISDITPEKLNGESADPVWAVNTESLSTLPQIIGIFEETGTKSNPTVISTVEGLLAIKDGLDKHYIIISDLDLQDITYTGPIIPGTFTGSLTGYNSNGTAEEKRTIKFAIDAADKNVGLFEALTGSFIIKNIKTEGTINVASGKAGAIAPVATDVSLDAVMTNVENNVVITCLSGSTGYIGGLIGELRAVNSNTPNYNFKNLVNNADITMSYGSNAGGIAGFVSHFVFDKCVNNGSLSSIYSRTKGGIVGYMQYTQINNSYNTGDIEGQRQVGGIAGYWHDSMSALAASAFGNCYNTGLVSAAESAGGILGDAYNRTNGRLVFNNCYNAGYEAATDTAGIFGGADTVTRKFSNCYTVKRNGLSDSSAVTDTSVVNALTKEAMQASSFATKLGTGYTEPSDGFAFPQLAENINRNPFDLVILTVAAGENGSADFEGSKYVKKNGTYELNFTPVEGSAVGEIVFNGVAFAYYKNSYLTPELTGDTEITVNFIAYAPVFACYAPFDQDIKKSEMSEMIEGYEAFSSYPAKLIFARIVYVDSLEFGLACSIDGINYKLLPAINATDRGAFGLYLYSKLHEPGTTFYVKPYYKNAEGEVIYLTDEPEVFTIATPID